MIKNPLSYPGNKNRIVKQIIPQLDASTTAFVDIFCGSGVVGVNSLNKIVHFNDVCPQTIEILKYFYSTDFQEIIDGLESLIDKYNLTYSRIKPKGFYKEYKHEGLSKYNKESYNLMKNDYNLTHDIPTLILLIIYGFNHYIRFNSKGEFNVPVGKVDLSASIYKNLKEFVDAIKTKTVTFSVLDFMDESLYEDKNALYYFDPPYLITTAPYNTGWNEDKEKNLLLLLDRLNKKNIKFCLSNVLLSNGKENKLLQEWCKNYKVININRQYRNANYQKINITDTLEVLIKNF